MPTESLRFYVRPMRQDWQRRIVWFGKVSKGDLDRALQSQGIVSVESICYLDLLANQR